MSSSCLRHNRKSEKKQGIESNLKLLRSDPLVMHFTKNSVCFIYLFIKSRCLFFTLLLHLHFNAMKTMFSDSLKNMCGTYVWKHLSSGHTMTVCTHTAYRPWIHRFANETKINLIIMFTLFRFYFFFVSLKS